MQVQPRFFLGLVATALLLLLTGCTLAGGDYYVSPSGSDANPGTREKPFATLERAREAIRRRIAEGPLPAGGIEVVLRGGTYRAAQTIEFSQADSGTAAAPIVYRGEAGEAAILSAGRPVAPGEFKPVTDAAILQRLDPAARGKVLCLDLSLMNLAHARPFPAVFSDNGGIFELFYNDKRMPLSRWPNEGYVTIAKVLDKGKLTKDLTGGGATFVYREERPAHWNAQEAIWLKGFWRVPWTIEAVKVRAIDAAKKQITLAAAVNAGVGSKYAGPQGSGKEPYCAINLIEEIDTPGEWCIDFANQKLYFWPPGPLDNAAVFLSDMAGPIVSFKDVSHVTLRGLSLAGGLGNAVEVSGGQNVLVAGCDIFNMGKNGVILRGGLRHGVTGCEIHEMGWGGVYLSGGDRRTLTPAGHFVTNNHIHDFGLGKKTYAPAVSVGSYGPGDAVGCRVANNLIHDAPHAGILYGGNDNIFEYNEIHHIALDSGDVGALYTWNDWTSRGNVIRYNFIHDSPNANGTYLDDGDSGDTVLGNLYVRMQCGPFIGGGHDNIVRNNISVECPKALHLDSRGVSRGYATSQSLIKRLQSVDYRHPPWSVRYPELVHILDNHPELPTGCVLENNVAVDCRKLLNQSGAKEHFQQCRIQDNISLTADETRFVDMAKLNFGLQPGSEVFRRLPAFQKIPFDRIGLYLDEYRTTLPKNQGQVTTRPGPREAFNSETDLQRSNRK